MNFGQVFFYSTKIHIKIFLFICCVTIILQGFRVMDSSASGVVQVFVGEWSPEYEALSIKATKQTSSAEIVQCIIERLGLVDATLSNGYELAEVVGNSVGQECKERRLGPTECPVALMLLWPKNSAQQEYYRYFNIFLISKFSLTLQYFLIFFIFPNLETIPIF